MSVGKIRFRTVHTSFNIALAFAQSTVMRNIEYPERTSKKDYFML
jgi:hypothetical protein